MNIDHITTALGAVVSLVQASQVDVSKLLQGDKAEVGKLVTALAVAAWGYFTNKGSITK